MFEYWLVNVRDIQEGNDSVPWSHHGTTTDFLEVVCEISRMFTTEVAGKFTAALMEDKTHELDFLRITGWEFFHQIEDTDQSIKLAKLGINVQE